MSENDKYYLLNDTVVGKKENDQYYLFVEGRWSADTSLVILKHLSGYDPTEESGSPYAVGNSEILDKIKEISEDEADKITGKQLFSFLTAKWKKSYWERRIEWKKQNPDYYAKHTSTSYTYGKTKYNIFPSSMGFNNNHHDNGFMETIQDEIEADLRAYGAKNIWTISFPD